MGVRRPCSRCGKRKSLDRFRPGRSTCWDCIRRYGSAWYRANKGRINEKRRGNYRENREEICARDRKKRNSPSPLGPYRTRMSLEGYTGAQDIP